LLRRSHEEARFPEPGDEETSGCVKVSDNTADLRRQLDDLSEKIDLVLPEVTARVAALEHLLREKQLVTRQDLVSARSFVRLQERIRER
jgi:Holliday junction resolvasome RuvABC endonuclease subunit